MFTCFHVTIQRLDRIKLPFLSALIHVAHFTFQRMASGEINDSETSHHFGSSDAQLTAVVGLCVTLCFSTCVTLRPQLREMPVNSPERPWRVDAAQVAERRDLRESHLVFSIDPQGCEDVDDTLSVRSLAGGKLLELGVHIADVTHFVAEGSLTDLEARTR